MLMSKRAPQKCRLHHLRLQEERNRKCCRCQGCHRCLCFFRCLQEWFLLSNHFLKVSFCSHCLQEL
jgi:hypothetical protein